jgi:drug/metabolite transporter (DMT)-like permease
MLARAVYLIWSSTYLGMKVAIATFPPMVLGLLRFGTAGAILFAVHLLRGGRWPSRAQVLASAPIGLLLFVGGNGFIALTQHEVASGVAAIVASTTPLWAALLGPFFGERARAAEWVGVVLGTTGVALLASQAELGSNWGMTLAAGAGVMGLGSMLRAGPQVPGLAAPALHMLWGALGMALLAPLLGEALPSDVSAETWAVCFYLVVFGSLIAFTAFTWLLRNTRPSLALSYSYVNPGLAVLLGALIGHEPLHATTIAATAVLAGAVAVVVKSAARHRAR